MTTASRLALVLVALAPFAGLSACSSVDCEALCQRTLACEITFAPADDPDGQLVDSGQRTQNESCALGCAESPTVTVESAACVDAVEISGDPATCQRPVAECLGVAAALDDDAGNTEGPVG
jgi:hypothetical protein